MERNGLLKGQVRQIYFARVAEGEDLAEAIRRRVEEGGVKAGVFIVIGSLKRAVLGYYKEKKYDYTLLEGPLEIASCTGNISLGEDGHVIIHAHVVVSNEKGQAFGGHLAEGSNVGVGAELVVIEGLAVDLKKVKDEKTNLNLWKLG
jgi:predicted DNA-binding protein with PD1-like motif